MKHHNQTTAWRLYENGKEYNRRIGLYETVRQNERFYRGDQWSGTDSELPRPVFNLIRRITDYLVASIVPGDLSIRYVDDKLPFLSPALRNRVCEGLEILNRNAAYRWKRSQMSSLLRRALLDAAISGDGVFYCYWDAEHRNGQPFLGEVRTELINATDLFVADVADRDLQTQEYVLLAGRASVSSLKREALENGVSADEVESIRGDSPTDGLSGDRESIDQRGAEKTTYLLYFRRENGEVVFEKATEHCVIRTVRTGLKYYPVAYFNWSPTKGSYHGSAPVSDMIANQKYVNTAYAMLMKHMYDTAFSKVIYDKTRIPEWTNTVGEAIAAVGGGNVGDAISVVGVGKMQDGYLELIENVISNTRAMMGATESALGDADATNTSAILVLQQASRVSLRGVRAELTRAVGELASIWADMLCAYCPDGRLLVTEDENGSACAKNPDFALLRSELLRASAEVSQIDSYTPSATVAVLDKLLEGGHIRAAQYVELLPDGTVNDRELLRAAVLETASEHQTEKGVQRNE